MKILLRIAMLETMILVTFCAFIPLPKSGVPETPIQRLNLWFMIDQWRMERRIAAWERENCWHFCYLEEYKSFDPEFEIFLLTFNYKYFPVGAPEYQIQIPVKQRGDGSLGFCIIEDERNAEIDQDGSPMGHVFLSYPVNSGLPSTLLR